MIMIYVLKKQAISLPGIDCVTVDADEQGLEKNTHISTLSAKTWDDLLKKFISIETQFREESEN